MAAMATEGQPEKGKRGKRKGTAWKDNEKKEK